MKSLNNKHKRLSDSVKTLSRQHLMILVMLALSALCFYWIKYNQPSSKMWDEKTIPLANTEELQLAIDAKLLNKTDIDQKLSNNIDDIIDDRAMQIKISGLTKNITLSRKPTNEELNEFYQQQKENYRQLSTFTFTQYLFSNNRYGSQAINAAQQILEKPSAARPKPLAEISLDTLEVNRLYGTGFSRKLETLVIQNEKKLPCWTPPVTSKVGAHLICFKQVVIGAIPKLEAIKPQLINHWRYETAKKQSASQ